jgi:class 3 adenylate cyclase/tetratricopeptide (TPR) repeat protein
MQCPRCRAENREGRRFCGDCGLSFASTCPSCGFLNEGSEKFCGGCGKSLTAAPVTGEAKFSSPQTYTPKHLAEKILTSKSALEGERKQVTVLFADLKGSMELLADRDPEEARKILDPVLERMMEAVHRYEGTVNQVMGDGIMALFGAPVAHEDHAVRACYAALRMQESVRRYAEEIRRRAGVPIHIRVGVNSGEVVVRSIGSDLRMDYTAVGQTTHLAARMEQAAMPGSILVTGDTLNPAEGYVQVRSLGPIPVKGLTEPVEAYEITGVGSVRTRLQAAVARGLTRFVGRDEEIDQLRRALEQAREGRGQVVALVGEPGVGKSRLFYEFTHSHRVRDWLILESTSVSYGKATSYLPVIDLLHTYFRIENRDDHRTMREKLMGKLLALDEGLRPTLPALLSLLDVPVDDPGWEGLDPPQRRYRILDAVRRLLLRESQVQPVLAIFEDLHWVDPETQAFLDSLVESLPTARLLLLVNYRPEYRDAWGGKTYYRHLRIDPLPPANVNELLGPLLGDEAGLEPLKRLLAERTEGNPLFLEESVRTLVETGVLVGERGAYRLAREAGPIRVPATVQAILAARIDRLSREDKALLQVAAVIGHDIPVALLEAVADLDGDALTQGVRRLQAAEFLYEARLFPDIEYTFKHGLTHEVAYEGLLHERRRDLHARILEMLERLYPDRLAEHVERLAHHAVRGERWTTAVGYLEQAARKALVASANTTARGLFEQALAAFERLAEDIRTLDRAIDLRLGLRAALLRLGEIHRQRECLEDAKALAERAGDEHRLGWVLTGLGPPLRATGEHQRAIEFNERALSIAKSCQDPRLEIVANFQMAASLLTLGAHERAIGVLEPNVSPAAIELCLDPQLLSLRLLSLPVPESFAVRALAWARLGEFARAAAEAAEGVRVAETSGRAFPEVTAWYASGSVRLECGDPEGARPFLERALEASRTYEISLYGNRLEVALACTWAMSGGETNARRLLDAAMSWRGSSQISPAETETWVAEAYLFSRRPAEAAQAAGRALNLARRRGEPGYEARARQLLGDVASLGEPIQAADAEGHYRAALVIAAGLGMRPLVAHCHLGLAKLYRRTGKGEQAQEHLATATTMYREMGMMYWLEKAEAQVN